MIAGPHTRHNPVDQGNFMDVVTQSLLKEFTESQKIEGLPQSDQFEAFTNYIVVSDIYPEEFDFSLVATGPGEFGIDGIAIIVNDLIVDDEEQLEDIISHSPVLQVQFLFIQAKTSSSFDGGDMSKFFQAVLDFFKEEASFRQNDRILELQRIKNCLYKVASKFVRGLPKVALYYATTGTWVNDKNLCAIRDGFYAQADGLHMFAATSIPPARRHACSEALFPDEERLPGHCELRAEFCLYLKYQTFGNPTSACCHCQNT